MGTTLQPTPEQIATVDPLHDMILADQLGITMAHRNAHIRTVGCDEPRCTGRTGAECRGPNGHMVKGGYHASRVDKAYNRAKTRTAAKRKLTDPQAEWLEDAAESHDHRLYAPDQYATLRGDAARRAKADAMERAGLIHQVDTTPDGWRVLELTDTGWATYWTHRLVIRRDLTPLGHPGTCPCNTTRPTDTN